MWPAIGSYPRLVAKGRANRLVGSFERGRQSYQWTPGLIQSVAGMRNGPPRGHHLLVLGHRDKFDALAVAFRDNEGLP
jgi:hypothetical protein